MRENKSKNLEILEKLQIEHRILDGILHFLRQYSYHLKIKWDDLGMEKTEEDEKFAELITGFDKGLIEEFISKAMSTGANDEAASGRSVSAMSGDSEVLEAPKGKSGGFRGEDLEKTLRENLSQVGRETILVLRQC